MADRKKYIQIYQQTEEYKIKNRAKSIVYNREKTRKQTKKRIQKHTIEELMKIVKETCQEKEVLYDSVKDQYKEFMEFLHDIEYTK
jgi:hypothetical protein